MVASAEKKQREITEGVAFALLLLSIVVLEAARNLDGLGHWFIQQDHVIEGIYCYETMTALSAVLGMRDFRLMAALDNLADAYGRMERYDDAIKTEQQVKQLVVRLEGEQSSNYNLANAHMAQFLDEKKQYAAARELLIKTIAQLDAAKTPSPSIKAYAMSTLMDVYLHEKNYEQAEKVGLKLLPLDDRMSHETSYSTYAPRLRLAGIYVRQKRLGDAEKMAHDALAASESAIRPLVRADAHDLMARVYIAQGKMDDAAREFNLAQVLINQTYGATSDKAHFWRARFDKMLADKNPFQE